MSSLVFLPPMTPASSATPRTSPFGPPPSITRLNVSGDTVTRASATARRAVTGLAETSTIRGRPDRSTWVSRRRSVRGAGFWAIGPPSSVRFRNSAGVEPPELHVAAGGKRIVRLGHDGERVGGRQGGDDVTPLPARASGEPNPDAAAIVPH